MRTAYLLWLTLLGCSSTSAPLPIANGGQQATAGQPVNTSGTGSARAGSGGHVAAAGGAPSAGTSGSESGSAGTDATAAGGARPAVDTTALVEAMGVGTNIGNTLDNTTAWETGWGQPLITRAFIDGIASRGIKTVRVPVAWDTYATNGTIDPLKLARVKEVVSYIEDAGMYAIVNIHWDGGWIYNEKNANEFRLTEEVKSKFAGYWRQLAQGFESVGPKLVFEGLNEEARFYQDGDDTKPPDYAAVAALNQLFVTTVRAQGASNNATRALLIAGFHTDIDLTCVEQFVIPTDPAGPGHLLLSLHYYAPFPFVLLDSVETWATPATTWGTTAEKQTLEAQFSKLAAFSAQRHVPIVLGEFGVTRGEKFPRDPDARILWMQSVAEAALSHDMVPVLWDAGSDIKRTDGSFSPEFQAVMDSLP